MSKNGTMIEDVIGALYEPIRDIGVIWERSALLLIDFLDYRDFFTRTATEAGLPETEVSRVIDNFDLRARKAANNAGELLESWREKGFEIFHIKSGDAGDRKKTGSENRVKTGLKTPLESGTIPFYNAVKPKRGELVFSQETADAFASTNLDFVLRNMNIGTLVICGLVTDQGVLFNTVQAVNRGYYVLLVEDACTALKPETHTTFIRWYRTFVNVKFTKEIIGIIEKSGNQRIS